MKPPRTSNGLFARPENSKCISEPVSLGLLPLPCDMLEALPVGPSPHIHQSALRSPTLSASRFASNFESKPTARGDQDSGIYVHISSIVDWLYSFETSHRVDANTHQSQTFPKCLHQNRLLIRAKQKEIVKVLARHNIEQIYFTGECCSTWNRLFHGFSRRTGWCFDMDNRNLIELARDCERIRRSVTCLTGSLLLSSTLFTIIHVQVHFCYQAARGIEKEISTLKVHMNDQGVHR